jgi:hypothetical protein
MPSLLLPAAGLIAEAAALAVGKLEVLLQLGDARPRSLRPGMPAARVATNAGFQVPTARREDDPTQFVSVRCAGDPATLFFR